MKILGVIPARGGSKSVPRKNIANIAGKPLIAYTIEEALKCNSITDVVVSTDDEEIAIIAKSHGALVPFYRPQDLASDQALSAPVAKHCLVEMEFRQSYQYDAVLLLQPTTPLRTIDHINSAISLFKSNVCDSVVSVTSVEGNHPFRMKRLIGDKLINWIDQGFEDMRPRQLLPPAFIRNGAIYLTHRSVIYNYNSLVGDRCLGFIMNAEDSINIDTKIDFKLAEILLKERLHK